MITMHRHLSIKRDIPTLIVQRDMSFDDSGHIRDLRSCTADTYHVRNAERVKCCAVMVTISASMVTSP